MKLTDKDWDLSMFLSRRGKADGEGRTLRSLLVHRLRLGEKAVLRVPLSENVKRINKRQSIYCEPCGQWFPVDRGGEQFDCPECERMYVMEFAVFAEVTGE
jgi:uncharacterized protein YbaR (Trm112 family)